MEYLEKVLGIKTVYEKAGSGHFPNFILARYRLQPVLLDGVKAIFLYPRTELEQIETLKKHIERIKKTEQIPAVLILKELTFRQKEYLIRERIPFVAEGKQIYLPFMALYLQERCSAEKRHHEEILPSAQMLFLHFIYQGGGELFASRAAKDLSLTPTSISRASKQLEQLNLLHIRKSGVQKILFSDDSPELLFRNAEDRLFNPVKRTVYIPKEQLESDLLESGYLALSEYSMLNVPNVRCYAAAGISEWNGMSTNILYDSATQAAVELWRYDPRKLSDGKAVDVLSLFLALREDADERVGEAAEEMLNNLWRRLGGNGN